MGGYDFCVSCVHVDCNRTFCFLRPSVSRSHATLTSPQPPQQPPPNSHSEPFTRSPLGALIYILLIERGRDEQECQRAKQPSPTRHVLGMVVNLGCFVSATWFISGPKVAQRFREAEQGAGRHSQQAAYGSVLNDHRVGIGERVAAETDVSTSKR